MCVCDVYDSLLVNLKSTLALNRVLLVQSVDINLHLVRLCVCHVLLVHFKLRLVNNHVSTVVVVPFRWSSDPLHVCRASLVRLQAAQPKNNVMTVSLVRTKMKWDNSAANCVKMDDIWQVDMHSCAICVQW